MTSAADVPVLEAVDVTKHFEVRNRLGHRGLVRAVENADVQVHRGSIVALVGESGSGKTTLARLLARFYPVTSGEVRMNGATVSGRSGDAFRKDVQLIFQDPFGSLNNLHRVSYILGRAVRLHRGVRDKKAVRREVLDLLERVSLSPAAGVIDAFPHELSGGQRQRVSIARALAVQPRVLLADEPISMLDVSIRLDILNLLAGLRDDDGLGMLYITHDIASARYLADTIQVMYAGQTVEGGPAETVISAPRHPYTQLLLRSSPDPARTPAAGRRAAFTDTDSTGEPPDLTDPPSGCRFHPRCPHVMERCRTTVPPRASAPDGTWVSCWLHPPDGSGAITDAHHGARVAGPATDPTAEHDAATEPAPTSTSVLPTLKDTP